MAEKCKNQLSPLYWYMLDDARGVLEGDVLTVRCGDELTQESLGEPEVVKVLTALAGEQAAGPCPSASWWRAKTSPPRRRRTSWRSFCAGAGSWTILK